MDTAETFNMLIGKLNSTGSIKAKAEVVNEIRRYLEEKDRRTKFENDNGDLLKNTLGAVIKFIKDGWIKSGKIPNNVETELPSIIKTFAKYSLQPRTEEEMLYIKNDIIDICSIIIPGETSTNIVRIWLAIMTELIDCKWFFNIFKTSLDQDTLSLLLETFIKWFLLNETYDRIKETLQFILTFLTNSPYMISENTAKIIFDSMDKVLSINPKYLETVLKILVILIPNFHVTIILNKNIFDSPFQKSIIDLIKSEFTNKTHSISMFKVMRDYLLQFLTFNQAVGRKLPQDYIDDFANQVFTLWTTKMVRNKSLSGDIIPYLKFDIEILKNSFCSSHEISEAFHIAFQKSPDCSDFMLLLASIAKYSPELIEMNYWKKILNTDINLFQFQTSAMINADRIKIPFLLFNEIIDYIDDTDLWDSNFTMIIKKIKNIPKEIEVDYYEFICHLLRKQRLSTKCAHNYQDFLWESKELSLKGFTEERIRCLQTMIFYYGFASNENRKNCFTNITSLLGSINKAFNIEIIEDIVRLICSIIQSHANKTKPYIAEKSDFVEKIDKLKYHISIGLDWKDDEIKDKSDKSEVRSESIDDFFPVKSQHYFEKSNESSQLFVTTDSFDSNNYFPKNEVEEPKSTIQSDDVSLCNFICQPLQKMFETAIENSKMSDQMDNYLFQLFRCKFAPRLFSESSFLTFISSEFNNFYSQENLNFQVQDFSTFTLLFLEIAKHLDPNSFQPFFESISDKYMTFYKKYLAKTEEKLKSIKSDLGALSWQKLNNAINNTELHSDFVLGLKELSEFLSLVSSLAPEFSDEMITSLLPIYTTTQNFPVLHISMIENLLQIPMDQNALEETLRSVQNVLKVVLNKYLVPIEEREEFVIKVLDILQNTLMEMNEMNDIFNEISKYPLTYKMKLRILNLAKEHYSEVPSLFRILWGEGEESDPFFILSTEQNLRIDNIEAIISVLSSDQIDGNEHDKVATFEKVLLPSYEGSISNPSEYMSDAYTALCSLTSICSKIPELTVKCIVILIQFFTDNNLLNYPDHAIKNFLKPFGNSHEFLQQFLPLIIKPLSNKDSYEWQNFPYKLFDDSKRVVFDIISPLLVPLCFRNDNLSKISDIVGLSEADLCEKYKTYLIPYLYLVSIDLEEPENIRRSMETEYKRRINSDFILTSPLPLLELSNIINDTNLLQNCYQQMKIRNVDPNFFDFHKYLIILYSKTYNAKHTIIQSNELKMFSLYCKLILLIHSDCFETEPWLYVDMFVFSRHLMEFAAPMIVDQLINEIAKNFPDQKYLKSENQRIILHIIEDICILAQNSFKQRFPYLEKLIKEEILDTMMIVDPYKDLQIQRRTFGNEFYRLSSTGKINKEGIDFMLKNLTESNLDDNSIFNRTVKFNLLKKFPNLTEQKRNGLFTIYQFIKKEKYPPSILLYTELQLRCYDIYPSPMIIQPTTISLYEQYLQSLNECCRDKDPKICFAALEAMRHSKYQKGIESQYNKDVKQKTFLEEYVLFEPSEINTKEIEIDPKMPWFCRMVLEMIKYCGKDIVFYPVMELASLSEDFCKKVFSSVFLSATVNSKGMSRFREYMDKPKQYIEENLAIMKALIDMKNYNFMDLNNMSLQNSINWLGCQIEFSKFSQIALKLGDPYLSFLFAEFSREASDDSCPDSYFMEIFKKLDVNELMYDLDFDVSSLDQIAQIHQHERRFNRSLVLYDLNKNDEKLSDNLKLLHLDNLTMRNSGYNSESLWRLQNWEIPSATLREMNLKNSSTQIFRIMQSFASSNIYSVRSSINDYFDNFHMNELLTVSENLSILLNTSTIQWFHALLMPEESDICRIFDKNYHKIYVTFLEKLTKFSRIQYKVTESSQMLNGIFIANKGFLDSNIVKLKLPNIGLTFFENVIQTACELKEVESAQYFVNLLRSSMKLQQPTDFQQIVVLNVDSPLRSVNLLKKKINVLQVRSEDTIVKNEMNKEMCNNFNHKLQLTLASWQANTHFERNIDVIENLREVIYQSERCHESEIMVEGYFRLATFAHNIHRESLQFFNSTEFTELQNIIDQLKKNKRNLVSTSTSNCRDVKTIENDISIHESHLDSEKEKFTMSITISIENYLKTMIISDKYNLESLYSVINLWFNYSFAKFCHVIKEMPEIIEVLEKNVFKINPLKILPLFYQLSARIEPLKISDTPSSDYLSKFQSFLRQLVINVSKSNTSATFPILHALTQNDKASNDGTISGTVVIPQKKIEAINELIDKIVSFGDGNISKVWNDMKSLLNCYIKLATNPMAYDNKFMSKSCPELFRLPQECEHLYVITDNKYTKIAQFEDKMKPLEGITKPVKIKVLGANGRKYHQILKGRNDDLRQDAVMQQLFQLSSQILEKNKPDLKIRSYKVVPLNPSAGIIEYVEKSISLGSYLTAPNGAHFRYKSNLSYDKVYALFQNASSNYHKANFNRSMEISNEQKREMLINTYIQICKDFKPCMRFFFIEKFSNTGDWFKARMNYCRQTATNSMVGYVFGIGDRHMNNILIDHLTGDVIHIDLGIAFEQGKMLRVREIVPFRMTPDIIDGFGHCGGSGVFRNSCEETLSLLRKYSEYLLTVLDVFLRDPLHNWNVVLKQKKSDKARGLTMPETSEPKTAESVIMRCRYKLEGKETGETLSVEGQVAQLISEATDPSKLAMMYAGWKPYL
ncbi:PIKK family atypical protein kinase [Trichomonas vaginalis G3]|uniref:non-specific serine/threonine protein kinase n=1 Tax=Trichomonas vaginalis (strain ATCC PRA-98 / G3) TaxID=412133 RepID=A2E491_TRIV3|nr:Serine/threonine-protein kinase ATM family [Trichomonas vaginalis G3]EAY12537.1 PIKK family atypical protein kinase [Trichomonas vaginalis G3]KAI5554075.1 Serine/threonine-protein kinase ATM family [Trichomonas vaginalis G3]|eukprot:XP_001324760.1 PIKK family atypical protein kinase [Trichomonas vaginalis G3]